MPAQLRRPRLSATCASSTAMRDSPACSCSTFRGRLLPASRSRCNACLPARSSLASAAASLFNLLNSSCLTDARAASALVRPASRGPAAYGVGFHARAPSRRFDSVPASRVRVGAFLSGRLRAALRQRVVRQDRDCAVPQCAWQFVQCLAGALARLGPARSLPIAGKLPLAFAAHRPPAIPTQLGYARALPAIQPFGAPIQPRVAA